MISQHPTTEVVRRLHIWHRWLIACLVTGLVFAALILLIYRQDAATQLSLLEQEAAHTVNLQQELLQSEIVNVESDLLYLATQQTLQNYFDEAPEARQQLEREYVNFAEQKRMYNQVRLLDPTGKEVVRINYRDGQVEVVAEDKLQSKESRYYFQQALQLGAGEVYVSPFDLNVEHGDIEQPIEPVIRFLTPVYDTNGERRGLLAFNFLGDRLLSKLKQLSQSFPGETMLLNPAGEYLQAPNPAAEWGWLLGHQRNFRSDFPNAWTNLSEEFSGTLHQAGDVYCVERLSPGVSRSAVAELNSESSGLNTIIMVARVPETLTRQHASELLTQLLLLYSGVMPLVIVLLFYWARSVEERRQHAERTEASEARLRQLSTALLDAQESERRNLSRTLHDELGQMVTAIRLDLGSVAKQQDELNADSPLLHAIAETDQLLESLHRIASSARPSVLDDLGLEDALESYFSEYTRRTGVAVDWHCDLCNRQIPTRVGENAYRIVVESLANVASHAKVDQVEVMIKVTGNLLSLSVNDEGCGFDPVTLNSSNRLGVLGMRERAELLDGEFMLTTTSGQGTRIEVNLPLSDQSSC